ncbi:MAG: PIN domain-containing protein [Byssovorax sp.]
MTRYLLDTNIISETARKKPDPKVMAWLGTLSSLSLPAVAVYEISSGIQRLAPGERRAFLEAWFAELLDSGGDVLPFDRDAALVCAALEAEARYKRRTVETRDLFILSIAKSKALGIATRNIDHFRGFGVPVYDPFKDIHLI